MRLVLRGGRLLDPATKRDAPGEVLIVDGKLAAVGAEVDATGARIVDVSGAVVAPGFVDLHSVLGDERDVDAALRGGFTTVVTVPASDSISSERLRVIKAAPLTRNLAGDELGETDGGARVLSQGFTPIGKAGVMRRALRYAAGFDSLLMVHAEDKSLSGPGVIGFGLTATRLGLLGVPESAETSVVARDLLILEETGGRLHFAHLTTARAVELIADAKRRGLKVSCDVTPHHLTRDTRVAEGYSLEARVWPPLRGERDVAALRKALAGGIIDAIACDHVRVDVLEREHPFESCAPGCEAFEQALPAAREAGLSLVRAIEALSTAPARLLGLEAGLNPGVTAALTVIDETTWRVRGSISGAHHTFPAGVVT